MNLRSAFSIYMLDGPCNDDSRYTLKANASRVVHAHLTPAEIAELGKLWNQRKDSKALFFAKVQACKDRLEAEGIL